MRSKVAKRINKLAVIMGHKNSRYLKDQYTQKPRTERSVLKLDELLATHIPS